VVVCLERGEDLHMVQLMPLSLTVSCFSKIQIGFTFLVPAHPGKKSNVSHKPGGRLPLLSARPAVTPATLKRFATNFAA